MEGVPARVCTNHLYISYTIINVTMSYSKYINDIDASNFKACIEYRKSLGISTEEDYPDCEGLKCEKGCPILKMS